MLPEIMLNGCTAKLAATFRDTHLYTSAMENMWLVCAQNQLAQYLYFIMCVSACFYISAVSLTVDKLGIVFFACDHDLGLSRFVIVGGCMGATVRHYQWELLYLLPLSSSVSSLLIVYCLKCKCSCMCIWRWNNFLNKDEDLVVVYINMHACIWEYQSL